MTNEEIGVAFWKFDKDGDANITVNEFRTTLNEEIQKAQ